MSKRRTMRRRLLSIMLPLTVLAFALVGFLAARILTGIVRDQHEARAMQTLEQIERSVEDNLYVYYSAALNLQYDADLQQLFRALSRHASLADTLSARRLLSRHFDSGSSIIGVLVFLENDTMLSHKSSPDMDVKQIKAQPWYRRFLASDSRFYVLNQADQLMMSPYSSYMFSMLYKPKAPYPKNGVEMIYFAFQDGTFQSMYRGYQFNQAGDILILDRQGSMIGTAVNGAHSDEVRALHAASRFDGDWGSFKTEQGLIVSYHRCALTGWTIVHLLDGARLTADIHSAILAIMALTAVVCLLVGVAVYTIVRRTVRPLERLTENVAGIAEDKVLTLAEEAQVAEYVTLSMSFNQITGRLRQLVRHVEQVEKDKARLEFAALQYQINPHFILNTISAIRAIALESNAGRDVDRALRSLSRLLGNCLSDTSSTHTLAEEKQYLQSYLEIIQIRYQKRLCSRIDFPEELGGCRILRFLLQPLVENSFLHGFPDRAPETGRIDVCARAEGELMYVMVADNGCGMSREKIDQVVQSAPNPRTHQFNGIGIYNVLQRVRMNYPGEPYGLVIESDGGGTRITLTLPLDKGP